VWLDRERDLLIVLCTRSRGPAAIQPQCAADRLAAVAVTKAVEPGKDTVIGPEGGRGNAGDPGAAAQHPAQLVRAPGSTRMTGFNGAGTLPNHATTKRQRCESLLTVAL
jgi:hypothetical protein